MKRWALLTAAGLLAGAVVVAVNAVMQARRGPEPGPEDQQAFLGMARRGAATGDLGLLEGVARFAPGVVRKAGGEEVVAALLARVAEAGARDRDGMTPLRLAVTGGHHKPARAIKEHRDQADRPDSGPSQGG